MTFFSFFFFLRLTYRFRTDDIKLNLKILHRYPFRTRFKRVFRNLERPSSLIISLTKMRNKIKIHRRTNRSVGPWKRQSVRTKRNYISKKFLASSVLFFFSSLPPRTNAKREKASPHEARVRYAICSSIMRLAEFRSGVVCPIRWLVVETLA